MHKNVHQGLHGEGFIQALACAGGFTTARANLDIDGVDLQIASAGPRGTVRSPKIEVQVKSVSAHPDSVTVRVPLRNLLTVAAMRCLLDGDLEGAAR
ncbi:hypothetical protein [Actinoplanes sp. HUAS TT8]|uniref:hypothetical protein n=1 Tax=Actinoplanes sp. HUAS TT8 TaxID=3447453 RepID=UPI003F522121